MSQPQSLVITEPAGADPGWRRLGVVEPPDVPADVRGPALRPASQAPSLPADGRMVGVADLLSTCRRPGALWFQGDGVGCVGRERNA
jgi:hypothetical protein